MAGLARGDHGRRRAADPLALGGPRVDPEPERDADGSPPGPEERDRAVDPAAHRDRRSARVGPRADRRPDRVRERIDRERLAADRRRLQERQPGQVPFEPGRVRRDDALPAHLQAHRRPVVAARGISEELAHGRA